MVFFILAAVALGVIWFWWGSSNTLFVLSVESGSVRVSKGRCPGHFHQVVREVSERPKVMSGRLKAVKKPQGVQLRGTGFTEGQMQRLRNALHSTPLGAFRSNANPANEQNFRKAYWLARLLKSLFRR